MAQNRTISEGEKWRPTPQFLPRLTIPTDTGMEPEAITLSSVTRFLTFCDKYGHAPPRTITPDDDEEPADYDLRERYRGLATDGDDMPTPESDLRDRRELKRKRRRARGGQRAARALDTAAGRRPPRPGGSPELPGAGAMSARRSAPPSR
ncbi:hypothetical protein DL764_005853 [Monosporascus ibericus]|uniref:Uncharacterized protein n=1 Tax=Monosporascus ibericus TaxID=155417 RepID=A0A4Q4TAL3_9PEZI|nr:hypothetical protein DL764_005853 [Monosporascus ibericus]